MHPLLVFTLLVATMLGRSTVVAQDRSDWHQPFPPHRIADNLYYVGSRHAMAITSQVGDSLNHRNHPKIH